MVEIDFESNFENRVCSEHEVILIFKKVSICIHISAVLSSQEHLLNTLLSVQPEFFNNMLQKHGVDSKRNSLNIWSGAIFPATALLAGCNGLWNMYTIIVCRSSRTTTATVLQYSEFAESIRNRFPMCNHKRSIFARALCSFLSKPIDNIRMQSRGNNDPESGQGTVTGGWWRCRQSVSGTTQQRPRRLEPKTDDDAMSRVHPPLPAPMFEGGRGYVGPP